MGVRSARSAAASLAAAPPAHRPEAAFAAVRAGRADLALAPSVVATVHPSSILRAGPGRAAAYEAFVRDLAAVGRWLDGRRVAA